LREQRFVGEPNAVREQISLRALQPLLPLLEGAVANAFRLDGDADDGAVVARNGVPHVRPDGDEFAIDLTAVRGRQPQAAAERDIDMECARATLARPAEEAGVKHPLRRDQHQMA
jgi:hypothetical protein